MKKALHIASAGIMAIAIMFSCIVFPQLTQAATKKTTVTISSPVKVKNGQTGQYTLYQLKGQKASLKIKAQASSGKLKYKTSNKEILTVSSAGVVKTSGTKTGRAVITVYSADNKNANAKIMITVRNFTPKLSATKLKLIEGSTDILNVSGNGVKSVVYKSSNTKVAAVNKTGKVKAIEAGTAKITATVTSESGVKTALTAKVVVEKAEFTFYLTRHGQTLFNVRGVGQGWCDSPLTEDGIAMAKKLGESMANIPFTACYTSISGRAYETAEYIIGKRNIPLIIDKNLRETHLGNLEGLVDNVPMIPDRLIRGWTEEGGETLGETADRVDKAIRRIIKENPKGGTFLVTSHGGALTAYLDKMFSDTEEWANFMSGEYHGSMPNCAVSVMKYKGGVFTIETISDVSYLGDLVQPNLK